MNINRNPNKKQDKNKEGKNKDVQESQYEKGGEIAEKAGEE
jgi:hypothetical protein